MDFLDLGCFPEPLSDPASATPPNRTSWTPGPKCVPTVFKGWRFRGMFDEAKGEPGGLWEERLAAVGRLSVNLGKMLIGTLDFLKPQSNLAFPPTKIGVG